MVDFLGPVAGAFQAVAGFVGDVLGSLDVIVVAPVAWLAVGAVVLGFKLAERGGGRRGARTAGWCGRSWPTSASGSGRSSTAFRLIAAAGLAPMLLFCLAFLVVLRLPVLVNHLVRAVVGPREWNTWLAIIPAETAIGFALSMVLVAPLLAAGVDWLVRTRTARRTEEAATTPAPV